MLEPIRHILSMQRIVLASTSPRRRELLESINFNFDVVPPDFEEKDLCKSSFSHPIEYVKESAKQKAISVWHKLAKETKTADLVIGCDTVVTLDGHIYEKPKDSDDAVGMLTKLSGRTHTVFTGVCLLTNNASSTKPDYVATTFHEATDVTFTEMSENLIRTYVATGEPLDKAGAYGVQGIGSTLVERIVGDYFNVVGLPLHRLAKELYYMHTEWRGWLSSMVFNDHTRWWLVILKILTEWNIYAIYSHSNSKIF